MFFFPSLVFSLSPSLSFYTSLLRFILYGFWVKEEISRVLGEEGGEGVRE